MTHEQRVAHLKALRLRAIDRQTIATLDASIAQANAALTAQRSGYGFTASHKAVANYRTELNNAAAKLALF